MSITSNQTTIFIKASAQKIYNFITAPQNWLGLHPVTKGIFGPDIEKSLPVGGVCIEIIDNPERDGALYAVWKVQKATVDRSWACESVSFGNKDQTVYFQYDLYEQGDSTQLVRTMITKNNDDTTQKDDDASSSDTTHMIYLENIKKKLEA